jgi:hypothetical protein
MRAAQIEIETTPEVGAPTSGRTGAVLTKDVPSSRMAKGVPAHFEPLPPELDRPANRKLTRQPVDLWHPLMPDLADGEWPDDWPEKRE